MNDKTNSAASAGGEFLSFTLGDEHYGVDILKVQESAATTPSPGCRMHRTTSRA